MGIIIIYQDGDDRGNWWIVTYPTGISRHYDDYDEMMDKCIAYKREIESTGGNCRIVDVGHVSHARENVELLYGKGRI